MFNARKSISPQALRAAALYLDTAMYSSVQGPEKEVALVDGCTRQQATRALIEIYKGLGHQLRCSFYSAIINHPKRVSAWLNYVATRLDEELVNNQLNINPYDLDTVDFSPYFSNSDKIYEFIISAHDTPSKTD